MCSQLFKFLGGNVMCWFLAGKCTCMLVSVAYGAWETATLCEVVLKPSEDHNVEMLV